MFSEMMSLVVPLIFVTIALSESTILLKIVDFPVFTSPMIIIFKIFFCSIVVLFFVSAS